MGKSLKEIVRERRNEEKAGKEFKNVIPEDPMVIKEDKDEGPSLLDQLTENKSGGEFSEILETQDNKSESEKKETTKLDLAESTDDEKPAKVETKVNEETDTVPDFTNEEKTKPDVTPIDSGKRFKVKTVYGDEELTETELAQGFMRNAHYTQVMQQVREQEKMVRNLLGNPQDLIEFAMANGVDLKQLVHAEPELPEFQLPELSPYASETEKAMYMALQNQNKVNKQLMEKVGGFEKSFKQSKFGSMNDQVEKDFREKRGDIPENAAHAVFALYKEGRRLLGAGYTINNALRDFNKAEGDIGKRWLESSQGKKWYEAERRKIIAEYANGKQKQRDEHLSPDNLNTAKGKGSEQKPKVTSMNWRELAKNAVGIKN